MKYNNKYMHIQSIHYPFLNDLQLIGKRSGDILVQYNGDVFCMSLADFFNAKMVHKVDQKPLQFSMIAASNNTTKFPLLMDKINNFLKTGETQNKPKQEPSPMLQSIVTSQTNPSTKKRKHNEMNHCISSNHNTVSNSQEFCKVQYVTEQSKTVGRSKQNSNHPPILFHRQDRYVCIQDYVLAYCQKNGVYTVKDRDAALIFFEKLDASDNGLYFPLKSTHQAYFIRGFLLYLKSKKIVNDIDRYYRIEKSVKTGNFRVALKHITNQHDSKMRDLLSVDESFPLSMEEIEYDLVHKDPHKLSDDFPSGWQFFNITNYVNYCKRNGKDPVVQLLYNDEFKEYRVGESKLGVEFSMTFERIQVLQKKSQKNGKQFWLSDIYLKETYPELYDELQKKPKLIGVNAKHAYEKEQTQHKEDLVNKKEAEKMKRFMEQVRCEGRLDCTPFSIMKSIGC